MKNSLKLLAISDIHYTASRPPVQISERKTEYGLEFLHRVLRRLSKQERPDALILLGDLVNGGTVKQIEEDLRAIKKTVEEYGIPYIPVPGNHDTDFNLFFATLENKPGLHCIKNFILYSFADSYDENEASARKNEDLALFKEEVGKYPDKRIITLQHNPIYPPIDSPYPFNLTNALQIQKSYEENNVALSLSGHYHQGLPLEYKNRVGYMTIPALCEIPFSYVIIEVEGDKIRTRSKGLKNDITLSDNHSHTQFAYCAEDITVDKVLERASLLKMDYVAFTEHAEHLYLTSEEYSKQEFYSNPGIIRKARERGVDRVRLFIETVEKSGSSMAKKGMEVCPDTLGGITVLPEDRDGLDILLGAIHFLPAETLSASQTKLHREFMKGIETLVNNRIDVLAHPFRIFVRNGFTPPKELFKSMVDILKSSGVAAELNFHTNRPALEFFALCLQEGVKISLGTDTHNLVQVGEFEEHLAFLKTLGVSMEELDDILFLLR